MLQYQAPLEEFNFLAHKVLRLPELLPLLPEHHHIDADLFRATLEVGAELTQEQLLPLNGSGDAEGCRLDQGGVKAPQGFKSAYRLFQENGWPALTVPLSIGGQGFPGAAGVFFDEMLASTNLSFSIFANVREGVLRCVDRFGDERARSLFSDKLASGEWLGTMCLTEPQAGSDLGLIRTTAVTQPDGSYLLSGTKIFISNGDHDLTENIVHLVLARTEGAPAGTGGLSLFVVPKYRLDAPTSLNGVSVVALEHKHGIRANATCALAFENAKGYQVGDLNRGLACMFLLMNSARLAVGVQTVGLAEVAYQNALRYTQERFQGRALNGATHPDQSADPLLSHIGVKSSLVQQRLFIEPARLLCAWVGTLLDEARCHPDDARRKQASQLAELLTPIVKGYLSQHAGTHITSALQLFGGHGYIVETGMEQLLRDAAICPIYEGTNYIQSLDLLGRKTLGDQGQRLGIFLSHIPALATRLRQRPGLESVAMTLNAWVAEFEPLVQQISVDTVFNRDVVGLVAPDFLELLGTVVFGYLWAWIADAAAPSASGEEFLRSKPALARLYFLEAERQVPPLIERLKRNASRLEQLDQIQLC